MSYLHKCFSIIFLFILFSNVGLASHVLKKRLKYDFDSLLSEVCLEANGNKKEFFKRLWSSDYYKLKKDYSLLSFQLKNSICLTEAQQIHVEIYLQHDKEIIHLDQHLTQTLAHLIEMEILSADLFNLSFII